MQLSDASHFDMEWKRLEQALTAKQPVVRVEGRAGTGRRALLGLLQQEHFAVVDAPPSRDPDAAIVMLLELATAGGEEALGVAQEDSRRLGERMDRVVACLRTTYRGVAIRLTDDGSQAQNVESQEIDRQISLPLMRELLHVWPTEKFPLVVLGTDTALDDLEIDRASRLKLRAPWVPLDAFDPSQFGPLAEIAEKTVGRLREAQRRVNPLELRWWIGLAALEEQSGASTPTRPDTSSVEVARRFAAFLLAKEELRRGALRLAYARRGVPRDHAIAFAPADDPLATTLLLDCAGYGTTSLQMHDQLRRIFLHLGRDIQRSERQSAHRDLANAHRSLDGTATIGESKSPRDWLERAHHLPHSGFDGLQEWRTLELLCRQFYWDCGRALSLSRNFGDAVEVFAECIRRFDPKETTDAYAQHYLGFNLDRDGRDRLRAESALRKAIDLDQNNVWWNCRLVTFLIDQARFLEARRQWMTALVNVDPDDYEVSKSPWLARHFHRWVSQAWLEAGEVELAREVMDGVPTDIVENDDQLRALEQRLVDAEEARALGESVYSHEVPIADRWRGPLWVPRELPTGEPLKHWYPGRIVSSNDETIVLVFATPSTDPAHRRTKVRELTTSDWIRAARRSPKESSGFIEIGVYDDAGQLLHIELAGPASPRFVDIKHQIRYLERWAQRA